jgi:tRNA (adenine37-N6)-methyltransferase
MDNNSLTLHPIGVIRSPFQTPRDMPVQPAAADSASGYVELNPEFAAGLQDIAEFSHLILLYHFRRAGKPELTVMPFLDTEPHGVFATRAPSRPNPLGISIVRLLRVEDYRLHIANLDILDATPLLDIKPYVTEFDSHPDARSGWFDQVRGRAITMRSDGRFSQP